MKNKFCIKGHNQIGGSVLLHDMHESNCFTKRHRCLDMLCHPNIQIYNVEHNCKPIVMKSFGFFKSTIQFHCKRDPAQ